MKAPKPKFRPAAALVLAALAAVPLAITPTAPAATLLGCSVVWTENVPRNEPLECDFECPAGWAMTISAEYADIGGAHAYSSCGGVGLSCELWSPTGDAVCTKEHRFESPDVRFGYCLLVVADKPATPGRLTCTGYLL